MQNHFLTPTWKSLMGSLAFLFLSFPLGLLYFIIVVTGFSVGFGTLVIWVGLPLLFATLIAVRGMAEAERRIISYLLNIPMTTRLAKQSEQRPGFLRQFGNLLLDPYTWTSTIYMIIKLPLGIFSFVVVLVLPLLSITLSLMPLVYMINLFVNSILLTNGIAAHSMIIPGFIETNGYFDFVAFARSFFLVPVGVLTWLVSRSVLTGLAWVSGEIGRALLGPGFANANTGQPRQPLYYNVPRTLEEQPVLVD